MLNTNEELNVIKGFVSKTEFALDPFNRNKHLMNDDFYELANQAEMQNSDNQLKETTLIARRAQT